MGGDNAPGTGSKHDMPDIRADSHHPPVLNGSSGANSMTALGAGGEAVHDRFWALAFHDRMDAVRRIDLFRHAADLARVRLIHKLLNCPSSLFPPGAPSANSQMRADAASNCRASSDQMGGETWSIAMVSRHGMPDFGQYRMRSAISMLDPSPLLQS